jgi:ABC-type transport system involved in multi-copper enzyme maturation permease subunit
MSVTRIWAIAANGFREGIRDRALYLIAFFALLFGLALQILPQIAATTEDKILLDFGLGVISLFSAIAVIFIGTRLVNQEIERRTVLLLIPKPLSRAEFIIGKHLGLLGVATVLVAAMAVVYVLGLSLTRVSYPLLSLAIALIYLVLELGLLIAAALVFSVFTSSLLATLLSLGIYLMGHLSRDLLALGQLSRNDGIERLTQTLYLILPDLSRLNLKNDAVYGLLPTTAELVAHAVYGIAYTVALLAIAIAIFNRRQF